MYICFLSENILLKLTINNYTLYCYIFYIYIKAVQDFF